MLYSQTMTDSKIEYDENFYPIAKICLRNDSQNKTITTVEVLVQYGSSDPYDWVHLDYKNIQKRFKLLL